MGIVSTNDYPDPQPGGGWLSGPCTEPRPSAALPQYNPSMVVIAVVELLGRNGITVVVDLGNAQTAITAAADLLRSLGCAPSSAPWRSR